MNKNVILFGVLGIVIAYVAWQYWPSSGGEVQISPTSVESGKAIELVARIKAIQIDTSFFDDPEFLSLESSPPPSFDGFTRGRQNPFLKLISSTPKPPAKR